MGPYIVILASLVSLSISLSSWTAMAAHILPYRESMAGLFCGLIKGVNF